MEFPSDAAPFQEMEYKQAASCSPRPPTHVDTRGVHFHQVAQDEFDGSSSGQAVGDGEAVSISHHRLFSRDFSKARLCGSVFRLPSCCLGRGFARVLHAIDLYWRGWSALIGSITFWSGAWDLLDPYLKDLLAHALSIDEFFIDVGYMCLGVLMLVASGTFVSSAGLRDPPPIRVLQDSFVSRLHVIISSLFSLVGQVSLGLGVYNMFDLYMFPETIWWNAFCIAFGLFLLLVTKTILFNSGTSQEADAAARIGPLRASREGVRSRGLLDKSILATRAMLGIVGAFVMWKGWEQMLDLSLGLSEVIWRELLYIVCGFILLLATRTFLSVSGVGVAPPQQLAPLPHDVHVNALGYTERRRADSLRVASDASTEATERTSNLVAPIEVQPYVPVPGLLFGSPTTGSLARGPSLVLTRPHDVLPPEPERSAFSAASLERHLSESISQPPTTANPLFVPSVNGMPSTPPDFFPLMSRRLLPPSPVIVRPLIQPTPSLGDMVAAPEQAAHSTRALRTASSSSALSDHDGAQMSAAELRARAVQYNAQYRREQWSWTWKWWIAEFKLYLRSSLAYFGVITMCKRGFAIHS